MAYPGCSTTLLSRDAVPRSSGANATSSPSEPMFVIITLPKGSRGVPSSGVQRFSLYAKPLTG